MSAAPVTPSLSLFDLTGKTARVARAAGGIGEMCARTGARLAIDRRGRGAMKVPL